MLICLRFGLFFIRGNQWIRQLCFWGVRHSRWSSNFRRKEAIQRLSTVVNKSDVRTCAVPKDRSVSHRLRGWHPSSRSDEAIQIIRNYQKYEEAKHQRSRPGVVYLKNDKWRIQGTSCCALDSGARRDVLGLSLAAAIILQRLSTGWVWAGDQTAPGKEGAVSKCSN